MKLALKNKKIKKGLGMKAWAAFIAKPLVQKSFLELLKNCYIKICDGIEFKLYWICKPTSINFIAMGVVQGACSGQKKTNKQTKKHGYKVDW